MVNEPPVSELSEAEATKELSKLAKLLAAANTAYHSEDSPEISDAEYDRLKRRNLELETAFPNLKLAESASDQVGAAPSEKFSKIDVHYFLK